MPGLSVRPMRAPSTLPRGGGAPVYQAAAMPTAASPQIGGSLDLESAVVQVFTWLKGLLGRLHASAPTPAPVTNAPAPAPAPAPKPAPAPPPSSGGTYTVRSGDSLSAIAQRTLGSASRWPEIYNLNQGVIGSNPNVIRPGEVLRLPGGSAPAPAPAPSSGGFGAQAVAAARQLQANGYHYTVNLTTDYHPVRFQVGCCADFAVDAWARAGIDLYNQVSDPHYCPTLVNYFRGGGGGHHWIPAGGRAQPGDMVFFDWNGDGVADHTAIVTAVDGNGKPTSIIESYDFNLPVRERAIGSSLGNVMGYGRA